MTRPDVRFVPCRSFGGGWLIAETDRGEAACRDAMGEESAWLMPLGNDGWILEPWACRDTLTALRSP